MENNIKPFGWRRNLDYFKENFIIMWKSLVEYKMNFLVAFIEQIIFFFAQFIFFIVFSQNFAKDIGWNVSDFLIFAMFADFIIVFAGFFIWKFYRFQSILVTGKLNSYINKPINSMFCFIFSDFSSRAFTMLLMNIIVFPIILIYFKISFVKLLIPFILFLFICSMYIFAFSFFSSINFFNFGISDALFNSYDTVLHGISKSYPAPFFDKNVVLKKILFFVPIFFIGSLLIPLINGSSLNEFYFQIIALLFFNLLFLLGLIMVWHYGLKRYEAFG